MVNNRGQKVLPAAYGLDLGFIWKTAPRLKTNVALWYLFLEQEFVYVGDAGIVEPSGRSRRLGVDLGLNGSDSTVIVQMDERTAPSGSLAQML